MDVFRSTPSLVAMILGVLILAGLAFLAQRRTEGFGVQGNVPSAKQTSMISRDTAASTSSNPTVAKPQPKDVQAALDSQTIFQVLVAEVDPVRTNLPEATVKKIQGLRDHLPEVQNTLKAALAKSDASPLSLDDVTKTRKQYTDAIASLRSATVKKPASGLPSAKPTVVAETPGLLSLQDLQKAQQRIHQEVNKLSILRSSSPTLEARITQLEKLQYDMDDLISKVHRGTIKIQEVPVKKDTLTAFLKALPNQSRNLPPLLTPDGTAKRDDPMVTKGTASPSVGNQAVQNLLHNAQYLKWNLQVNLEFNPEVAQRGEFMKRLQATEDRLMALAVSETPIPKEVYAQYMEELKTLQAMLSSGDARRAPPIDLPSSHATRTDMGFTSPDYPSSAQLDAAEHPASASASHRRSRHRSNPRGSDPSALYDDESEDEEAQFPGADPSSDTQIRPGFNMDDATIARRASSSSFDPAAVGGPDYKKRAQELCRQVQNAQLGDPKDFGCIANPDEVSSSYSWKGNYKMVCNRIGDTWGGWYPEMFGCPKYNSNEKFKGAML